MWVGKVLMTLGIERVSRKDLVGIICHTSCFSLFVYYVKLSN